MLGVIITAFGLFSLSFSAQSENIYCPRIPPPKSFNISKIMGSWYEILRDSKPRKVEKCAMQAIIPGEAGSLRLTTLGFDSKNDSVSEVSHAFVRDEKNPHILSVKFSEEIQEIPFAIVDVGHSHMLVHSCLEVLGLWKIEEITLYSRSTGLDMKIGLKMVRIIKKLIGLPSHLLKLVDQTECRGL